MTECGRYRKCRTCPGDGIIYTTQLPCTCKGTGKQCAGGESKRRRYENFEVVAEYCPTCHKPIPQEENNG